jgi:hypothetical protein
MARTPRRGPAERGAAWLYTGPLGHLYSTLADIAVAWGRWAAERARARLRGGAAGAGGAGDGGRDTPPV